MDFNDGGKVISMCKSSSLYAYIPKRVSLVLFACYVFNPINNRRQAIATYQTLIWTQTISEEFPMENPNNN